MVVSSRRRLRYVNLFGVIPEEYTRAATTLNDLELGSVDDLVPREKVPFPIILGHDLARNLGVTKGSVIRLAVPRLSSPGHDRE